MFDEIYLE